MHGATDRVGPVAISIGLLLGALPAMAHDVGSRIRATAGVPQIEGTAGGGFVPWAVLAGYGQKQEWGGEFSVMHARTGDFDLTIAAGSVAFNNRVEISAAAQLLDIDDLGLPDDNLSQMILGAKVRVAGDLIYGKLPQISGGVQYKRNMDFDVPALAGARDDDGFDFYVAATRLWLNGLHGYPVLANVTVRASRANQLGLLGFGGDQDDEWEPLFEGSVAVLLRRDLVLGYEYRQKPDNLGFADEDDWQDVFLAWFPNKYFTLTGAWADLGDVAGRNDQEGFYVSVESSF
ncbi:MAG: DUF3034 family protein [Gammaproteobacteria bacterium]|nr:DUF3034 family protein [Gammaproteobacteria bacterium]